MLSYRHGFHAGNLGDVLKHLCLLAVLRASTRKPAPIAYLESHAGAGSYALDDANPDAEYRTGVAQLWAARTQLRAALLVDYLELVHMAQAKDGQTPHALRDEPLHRYPGSPWLARACLRSEDELWLAELHPSDYPRLKDLLRGRAHAHVARGDGYEMLRARLPPRQTRGVVLIDPAYELADEADRAVRSLTNGFERFGHGTYLLWAPLRGKAEPSRMERALLRLEPAKLLRASFTPHEIAGATRSPLGSVLWLVNPPYLVDAVLESAFAECAPLLAVDSDLRWLRGG